MKLLVVSHPCVIPVNQAVYGALGRRGWDIHLVVPSHWRDEFRGRAIVPRPAPELEGRFTCLPVALSGRPQRHVYLARVARIVRRWAPDIVFLEQESFSLTAFQWGRAAKAFGVPFGVQGDENLDRRLPLPARLTRSWVLRSAACVAARSPAAEELVRAWGATGTVAIVPHPVPLWPQTPRPQHREFTVGFAGRLVEEKGVRDLLSAVQLLEPAPSLLFIGDGPLRPELEAEGAAVGVEIDVSVTHERMPEAYARMDVLVLPSRTTPRWAEQFGRVLTEALWCGVPVVGSSSGAIPWLIDATGGGVVYPEGDIRALAAALADLRDRPHFRNELALRGREAVERRFGVMAAAKSLDRLLRCVATDAPQEPSIWRSRTKLGRTSNG